MVKFVGVKGGLGSGLKATPIRGVPGLAERFAEVEALNMEIGARLQAERKFVGTSEVEQVLDKNYRLFLDL